MARTAVAGLAGSRPLVALALALALASGGGCSFLRALDFGGDPGKSFEFRFGWERGIEHGTGKPGTVDPHGVYTPEDPAAEAVFSFPAIHAGFAFEVQPESRLTPTIGFEIFRFKVPWARWWIVQAQAGSQLAEVYLGKRIVALVDVTAGPWMGWDFEERAPAWGAAVTMVRF
jgi:hypothetical protein